MGFESNVERQEFNEIEMARTLSYEIGLLLSDKLGKMLVEAYNYYPTDSTVSEGTEYTLDLDITDVEEGTVYNFTPTYTALATDGVTEVLEGLGEWVTDNASDYIIANVYTDYTSDEDKHMFFIAKDGYTSTENSKTNLVSDDTTTYTPSDTPASYVGYGTAPSAEYPRIVVTPMVSTTVCDRLEESVMEVDEEETEYTSSYVDFSMNITCEAGDTTEVLKSGMSAQHILNHLRKRMVNEQIKKNLQNEMNSVYHPIEDILPLPIVEATQYMSIARCTSKWSTIDIFYPDDISGFMEAVVIAGSTTEDPENLDGVYYKYNEDDEDVAVFSREMTIDRNA